MQAHELSTSTMWWKLSLTSLAGPVETHAAVHIVECDYRVSLALPSNIHRNIELRDERHIMEKKYTQ